MWDPSDLPVFDLPSDASNPLFDLEHNARHLSTDWFLLDKHPSHESVCWLRVHLSRGRTSSQAPPLRRPSRAASTERSSNIDQSEGLKTSVFTKCYKPTPSPRGIEIMKRATSATSSSSSSRCFPQPISPNSTPPTPSGTQRGAKVSPVAARIRAAVANRSPRTSTGFPTPTTLPTSSFAPPTTESLERHTSSTYPHGASVTPPSRCTDDDKRHDSRRTASASPETPQGSNAATEGKEIQSRETAEASPISSAATLPSPPPPPPPSLPPRPRLPGTDSRRKGSGTSASSASSGAPRPPPRASSFAEPRPPPLSRPSFRSSRSASVSRVVPPSSSNSSRSSRPPQRERSCGPPKYTYEPAVAPHLAKKWEAKHGRRYDELSFPERREANMEIEEMKGENQHPSKDR